jgi:opacity protein-like surface antigen
MTSRITKTVALAALMASTAGAAYATEGWYGRADVGYTVDGEIEFGGAAYDFEDDWTQHLGLGYAFQNGFRFEGELAHRYNDFGENEGLTDGNVHAWSGMLNGYYDFNRGGSVQPYIGLGVGAARLNVSAAGGFGSFQGQDTVLAYQGMVGVAFDLTEQLALDVGYRYFVADDADFDGVNPNLTATTFDAEYEHQAVTLGLQRRPRRRLRRPHRHRHRLRRRQPLLRARRRTSWCTSSGIARTSTKLRSKPSMRQWRVRASATSAASWWSATPTPRARPNTISVCRNAALRWSAMRSSLAVSPPARLQRKLAAKPISPVRRATACVSR